MTRHEFVELSKMAFDKWSDHKAPRLAASLAFYTLLSMAPLMVVIVAICGLVFGTASAEPKILAEAQELVGPSGTKALQSVIDNAHHSGTGIFASLVAIATLFFGASGVFIELRDALNTIWDVPGNSTGIRGFVLQRLTSFAMVLGVGFLLLVSLVFSAVLAIVMKFFTNYIPLNPVLLEVVNLTVSTIAIGTLFALIFKFVPDVHIDWHDVGIGAGVTAVLFIVGKTLLALYLGTAGVGSTYGAAGSLIVLVVWVYYSAQIFLLGAVFTSVYAEKYGSKFRPSSAANRKSDVPNHKSAQVGRG